MLRHGLAPAKLNLALELVGRRDDGYHLIRSVSHTIDWSDAISLELGKPAGSPPGPVPPPEVLVGGPEAAGLTAGNEDLAGRAALLMARSGLGTPVERIALAKRIPPRSGLGGGSADAAAVIRMTAERANGSQLRRIALQCGADVPFALCGGAALIAGIGDEVVPLPPLTGGAFLIAFLGPVSTADAYAASDGSDFTDGSRVDELAEQLRRGTAPAQLFGSALERPARAVSQELDRRADRLRAAIPQARWAMTGSGGAFFAYLSKPESVPAIAEQLQAELPQVPWRIALPISGWPEPT